MGSVKARTLKAVFFFVDIAFVPLNTPVVRLATLESLCTKPRFSQKIGSASAELGLQEQDHAFPTNLLAG